MFTCPHCKNEFEIESVDQVSIYNPKIPLLSVKCTECNKNTKKNKKDSLFIIEQLPELENEIEQAKAALAAKVSEEDDLTAGVGDFEEKFRDQLSIFGLNSKKYENKIKAVLKLIERTGATRDWLKYHMQKLGLGNKALIESVVDLVFLDEGDAGPVPPYPTSTTGSTMPGYSVQTLPGGQIIIVPSQTHQQAPYPFASTQPIIIERGGKEQDNKIVRVGSEQVIEEELDENGKVTKRIIRGAKVDTIKEKSEGGIVETLNLLKDLGIIGATQPAEPQPKVPEEVRDTLKELKEAVGSLSIAVRDDGNKQDSDKLDGVTDKLDKLHEKISKLEKEKADMRDNEFKDHLNRLERELSTVREDRSSFDRPKHGLSDSQFEVDTKHRNLVTMADGFDRWGERVTAPLNKMLENQTRLNAVIMLRDLEKQDGVPPGTYLKAMQTVPPSSDVEVRAAVEKWKNRAVGAAPGGTGA